MKKLIITLVLCVCMIMLTAYTQLGNLNVIDTLKIDSVNFVATEGTQIKLLDTLTNFRADTLRGTNYIAQFHRMDSLGVAQADTFYNVKWDTLIAGQTTRGFDFGPDSTYFLIGINGVVRVQGCGHWLWTGGNGTAVKIFTRVLKVNSDTTEAICLQSNDSRSANTDQDGTLSFKGTIDVTDNDTLYVQYRVSNAAMIKYRSQKRMCLNS